MGTAWQQQELCRIGEVRTTASVLHLPMPVQQLWDGKNWGQHGAASHRQNSGCSSSCDVYYTTEKGGVPKNAQHWGRATKLHHDR